MLRAAACYLTGVHPKKTEGADIRAGISMDQIAARHVGAETQLASMELGCDPNYFLGACDAGYSCAYGNTLSWRTETTPLPVGDQPARGVRTDVWRRGGHQRGRPASSHPGGSKHPGLAPRGCRAIGGEPRRRPIA